MASVKYNWICTRVVATPLTLLVTTNGCLRIKAGRTTASCTAGFQLVKDIGQYKIAAARTGGQHACSSLACLSSKVLCKLPLPRAKPMQTYDWPYTSTSQGAALKVHIICMPTWYFTPKYLEADVNLLDQR